MLLRRETYDHSYPHCWRCREPLIYMAVSSWFVEVTKFKDRMVELNQEITWVPEHVKDGQFGKWLENARDWSISRNRFWGSPIPVWRSDNPEYPRIDVYGSFEELERDFGRMPLNEHGEPDLHRPFIDHLTRPNPDDPTGNSTMRRVEDVLDVWFDSGSMSFAQVHYPFENAEWFEHHFPGDFIVEYIGQTRGWFYTLHVLATALFDRPAFSSCVSHGIVLGSDGQKMSKSLKNYPDVSEVFNRDGADAMRWFLMSSGILRGSNLVVTEEGIREGVRQVLIPLWNSWSFFSLYANAVRRRRRATPPSGRPRRPTRSTATSSRSCAGLVETVQGQMDAYDIPGACESVRQFVDAMTNWYIRRSRERFWDTAAGDGAVARAAFDTLYTTLEVLTRVAAPLLPLVTEEIWRGLTGGRSVHLEDWPDAARPPGRRRARRRDGPGAGRVLHRLVAAQGREAAGAPAAAAADRRHHRPRGAAARSPASSPTSSTSRRSPCSTSPRRTSRTSASASGSSSTPAPPARAWVATCRPRSRAARPATGRWPTTARSPRAGSRLVDGRVRASRPSSTRSRPARTRPGCCPAAGSSCSTPT